LFLFFDGSMPVAWIDKGKTRCLQTRRPFTLHDYVSEHLLTTAQECLSKTNWN